MKLYSENDKCAEVSDARKKDTNLSMALYDSL